MVLQRYVRKMQKNVFVPVLSDDERKCIKTFVNNIVSGRTTLYAATKSYIDDKTLNFEEPEKDLVTLFWYKRTDLSVVTKKNIVTGKNEMDLKLISSISFFV